jgi:hypothetical protein
MGKIMRPRAGEILASPIDLQQLTSFGSLHSQFAVIQSVAQSVGVEVSPINLRDDAGEIERAVTAFARAANGGLIVAASASATVHRDLIITLAARHIDAYVTTVTSCPECASQKPRWS